MPIDPDPKRRPTHPGFLIADILKDHGITHELLKGRESVTPETAAALGKLFGSDGGLWLSMQEQHDQWDRNSMQHGGKRTA